MERFKSSVRAAHSPPLLLHASLESSALVRLVHSLSDHRSLSALLSHHLPYPLHTASSLLPPAWLAALSSLHDVLQHAPHALTHAYQHKLHHISAVSDADHFAAPVALVLAAWVAEADPLATLAAGAQAAKAVPPPHSAAALARDAHLQDDPLSATPNSDLHDPLSTPLVLLVRRNASRQDAAALPSALAAASNVYGPDNVLLLTLDAEDGAEESPAAVAAAIRERIDRALAALIDALIIRAERVRKATRSSFRSWFGGSTASAAMTTSPLRSITVPSSISDASNAINTEVTSFRRLSIGAAGVSTPQFAPDSLEALSRRVADLCMFAGRYATAADWYHSLAADCRSLVGAAKVHEAAAQEGFALATAMIDGSKQAVGAALEKCVKVYCEAGRRELAVRATLRAVAFCNEAGFPDSAAGVIIRALEVISPPKHVSIGPSARSGTFVEGASGVLYSACADAYASLRKPRRATLYAFLSARKFANLKFYRAAARVIGDIDEKAMLRAPIRNEVELILGNAEVEEGRHASAIRHFVGIMGNAKENEDVEVQGSAVRGFLDAATTEARKAMEKRWDSGAMFPLARAELSKISTYDSGDADDTSWRGLEDDVLEDFEYFRSLASEASRGSMPKRERRIESVIAELRKEKEDANGDDPGGSLEMKIKRMRETSNARKKKRRSHSLLDRGAVVGESIRIHVTLSNPLHFPVFLENLAAVVSLNGTICTAKRKHGVAGEEDCADREDPIQFVPTDKITLVPCSVQRISVDVIPMKPGELQFIGLTWSFTIGMGGASAKKDKLAMPGFCLLEKRGRRLNSTRKQRASEVPLYERDETLIATVTSPEPRISSSIISKGNGVVNDLSDYVTLRAGETRPATLLLRNEGNLPIDQIVFRIGTPQTFFASLTPDRFGIDDNPTTFAIGMNDQTEFGEDFAVAARVSMNLKPKETKSVPVLIRAAVPNSAFSYRTRAKRGRKGAENKKGSGGKDIAGGMLSRAARMIIAYGTEKVRVSRIEWRFMVQPSILVSPRFLRQADQYISERMDNACHGVLLGLEIEHGGDRATENAAFEVTGISITSQEGWKPLLLQEPSQLMDKVSSEISQSQTSLRINETATVFFFVVRNTNSDVPESGQSSWRTETVELMQDGMGKKIAEEKFGPGVESSMKYATTFEDGELGQKASTYFVLYASYGGQAQWTGSKQMNGQLAYVSVGWRSSSKINGQVHIAPIDPLRWMQIPPKMGAESAEEQGRSRDATIPSSLSTTAETWVSVSVKHAKHLEHNFSKDAGEALLATPSPLMVPVDVSIRNTSEHLLDVVFAAPTEGGIADGDRGRFWAGDVAMSLRALPPGMTRMVRLTAVITEAGRFNMGRFAVVFQSCGYAESRVRGQVEVTASYMVVEEIGKRAGAGLRDERSPTGIAVEMLCEKGEQAQEAKVDSGDSRAKVAEKDEDGKAEGGKRRRKKGQEELSGRGRLAKSSTAVADDAVWNASDTESES